MKRYVLAFLLLFAGSFCLAAAADTEQPAARPVFKSQGYLPFADAPINYRSAQLDDPIARIDRQLEAGTRTLNYDARHGYLPAVLDALHIPVTSQALVFSKTSFQFPLITPSTPRALYYNDDVYVGRVLNAKFLEFASFDPKQGAIFYVLDSQRSDHPRFERAATDCIQCHVTEATKGVPGVMLRSVFTRPTGYPAGGARSFVTGQESPWNERWGGWYVTAAHSTGLDMGNALSNASDHPEQLAKFEPAALASQVHLNTASYLTDSSDVVALLVLAHQTQMHNLITLTNYRTRLTQNSEQDGFEPAAEKLVRYMLFANEAALAEPLARNSSFAVDFAARGPFDSHGRSLRQFDLQKRIFRYPCSYLIYSETFDALPEPAKGYVLHRLFEVLSGEDQGADFQALSAADRRAILEILVETKPGLPPEWPFFLEHLKEQTAAVQQRAAR